MLPNLQKPSIMAHTKTFSIIHYKNLVQTRISLKLSDLTKAIS